jgi:hypothetical protein
MGKNLIKTLLPPKEGWGEEWKNNRIKREMGCLFNQKTNETNVEDSLRKAVITYLMCKKIYERYIIFTEVNNESYRLDISINKKKEIRVNYKKTKIPKNL